MPNTLALERILVTGGSGFIGQHLLRALVALGNRPIATTRSLKGVRIADDLKTTVDWVEVDWIDPNSFAELNWEPGPVSVFHLAGVRVPDSVENAYERNWQGNVVVTENLLQALHQRWDLERFVALGSAEEYGEIELPMKETSLAQPVTSYGRSKARMTAMVKEWHRDAWVPAVVLRPFSVYGPGQPRQMFISQAIDHAVAGEDFAMTEGQQRRDLVYVSDVVSALLSVRPGCPVDRFGGHDINIGSGESRSLRQVAQMIWLLSGTEAELQIGARPAPPEELHDTWADISRARELLNWEPRVDLATGLRATIEWARTAESNTSPEYS
ncbi:MAG: NAD(P)-dependent oxidoreductase [Pyrinomonadaceae bacterium]